VFDASGEAVAGAGVTGRVSLFHPETQPALERMELCCARHPFLLLEPLADQLPPGC
jgi:hypothetical protein